jgi:Transposase DDE domain group 1
MAWCEANDADYILGLPSNAVLDRLLEPVADDIRLRRAEEQAAIVRGYADTLYGAKPWHCQRRGRPHRRNHKGGYIYTLSGDQPPR